MPRPGSLVGPAMKHTSPVNLHRVSVLTVACSSPCRSRNRVIRSVNSAAHCGISPSAHAVMSDVNLAFVFTDACFSPDGKHIVIEEGGMVEVVDTEAKTIQKVEMKFGGGSTGGVSRPQRRIAMAPDGSRVLICAGGDEALFLDLHSMTQVGPRLARRRHQPRGFPSERESSAHDQ